MSSRNTKLIVAVGDIHGRFHRVREWIAALEQARGREAELVLAVGDVEAFAQAEDHRRKAAKRTMPAEFSAFASGAAKFDRPLYFIGGNNEDFEALHGIQGGGEIAPGVHYLGRVGVKALGGVKIAFLSGILAPKHFDKPLAQPSTQETRKQAGYFRRDESATLAGVKDVDFLLVHEWPKGLLRRTPNGGKTLRAYRFPWIGNPISRELMDHLKPRWLFAGHSHVPFSTTVTHPDGTQTRVACLDQAAKPDGAIFWLELEGREAMTGGWGITGEVAWKAGEPFTEALTPEVAPADDGHMH